MFDVLSCRIKYNTNADGGERTCNGYGLKQNKLSLRVQSVCFGNECNYLVFFFFLLLRPLFFLSVRPDARDKFSRRRHSDVSNDDLVHGPFNRNQNDARQRFKLGNSSPVTCVNHSQRSPPVAITTIFWKTKTNKRKARRDCRRVWRNRHAARARTRRARMFSRRFRPLIVRRCPRGGGKRALYYTPYRRT